ncbi:hypothetical protein HJC23_010806 [Cyclotella cryptica]|uniref:Uncharacterized protein n=1 Tax=Cyclotella cryptica TaxID=29204 RepID=A0ABD3QVH1_9STRA
MNRSTEQELHSMYGKQFSSRNISGAGMVDSSQGRVWLNDCDDLIAKYSTPTSVTRGKDSGYRTVSLIDSTNSYGDLQGVETISFDKFIGDASGSKYNLGLNEVPGLEEAFSTETAELIKKATSVRVDAVANRGGHSVQGSSPSTPSSKSIHTHHATSSDEIKRMLLSAKEFEESLNDGTLHTSSSFKSSVSHQLTPPASNCTLSKDPSDSRAKKRYDEAQRLLTSTRKFEESVNRVALDPPEYSIPPRVSPKKPHNTFNLSRERNMSSYGKEYSAARRAHAMSARDDMAVTNKMHDISSRRNISTPRFTGVAAKFPRDFNASGISSYSPNSVRFASDNINQQRSFRSSTSHANLNDVHFRLQDLNARSQDFKASVERGRADHLPKTWSEVRSDDIDLRLDYLKRRCMELRQHTELPGHPSYLHRESSDGNVSPDMHSNTHNGQYSTSIRQSRSDGDKGGSHHHSSLQSAKHQHSTLSGNISTGNAKTPISSCNAKPVALKILSERVLSGYHITRETCSQCGVTKLSKWEKSHDGSASVAEHVECVFCPINDLRSQIQSGIARKILASKLLMGHTTLSRGKLCELCMSPTLVQPDGAVICEVCPVLDAVCLEVSRAQSNGGKILNAIPCNDCGAKTVSMDGQIKCLACKVMKEWQVEQRQQTKQMESSPKEVENILPTQDVKRNPSTSADTSGNTQSPHDDDAQKQSSSNQDQPDDKVDAYVTAAMSKDESAVEVITRKPKIFESLMGQCGSLSNGSQTKEVALNISNLQSQLLKELAKAKQCQLVLENSIEDGEEKQGPSAEDLKEELAKAKRCQYALERIIETTSDMDKFPSVEHNQPDIDDMMSAPELKGSFSISQQEVEAGRPKEYIPPPSFFRSGIPSTVEVTLISPAPDSNLAQAYQTNLKNTDNDKRLVSKSRVGIDFWPFTKASNDNARRREEEQGGFDYDTIQTDDFTVDYTLNTVDDSRLEYLHIKSKNANKVRFQVEEEKEQQAGCSFFPCFGCGDYNVNEERQDDVYRSQDKEDIQREKPNPESWNDCSDPEPRRTLYDPPSQKHSSDYSAASESQMLRSNGPAWIGSGTQYSSDSNGMQEPPTANDYSEISDVSGHVLRSSGRSNNTRDRYEVQHSSYQGRGAPQKRNNASDYSAVSDITGSIQRMQDIVSVTSDNSGSMGQLSGPRKSASYRRNLQLSRRGSSNFHRMGVLPEDESIDTSIDKHIINRSMSGHTAEMKKIVRGFERSNPAAVGV